jgi:hypothetical protein
MPPSPKTGAALVLAWAESKHEAELIRLAKDPSSLPVALWAQYWTVCTHILIAVLLHRILNPLN